MGYYWKDLTQHWRLGDQQKGKESGINYEYDCIKSFVETDSFSKLSAKFGLDSQIVVDYCKSFAYHINVPKEKWTKDHEPFKDICKENEIVNDDSNRHDPISTIMFYISMLIFVEWIDLVKGLGLKKINIVSNISMKELANGLRIYINLLEN